MPRDGEANGPRPGILVEACIASIEDAIAAAAGGAGRLELNRALHRDGLTPALETLEAVLDVVGVPVIVMIRPHDDGFTYSTTDCHEMLEDAASLLEGGAAGIAVGPLTPAGDVDTHRLKPFVSLAAGRDVVFHRAFDVVRDAGRALETLIDSGVTRVLTSGQAPSAAAGVETLARLVSAARGRIEVLPGAGIRADNAAHIVARTGCDQLHGTFRGAAGAGGTSAAEVAAVLDAANDAANDANDADRRAARARAGAARPPRDS